MLRFIRAEFMKLKGSSIVWVCLAACCILPLIGFVVNLEISAQTTWASYSAQNLWLAILLLWPSVFGLIGTYIFTRESIENTYRNLFIIPVGRVQLAIAKLATLLLIILAMASLSYMLNFLGLFIGIPFETASFWDGLITYLKSGLLMFFSLLPVLSVAVICRKGYLIAICATMMYTVLSFVGVWSSVLSSILPVVTILRVVQVTSIKIEYAFPMSVSYSCMAVIGVVSVVSILWVLKKQDL